MIQNLEYVKQSQFPLKESDDGSKEKGEGPKQTNWPEKWDPPHWHGDQKGNSNLEVFRYHYDGTRHYYCEYTGTDTYEHFSGHVRHVLKSGVVENTPGKHVKFVGAGGSVEHVGGSYDHSVKGPARHNYASDTYFNTQGSQMSFVGGTSGHIAVGNHQTIFASNYYMRGHGENAGFGISMGKGGSPQNSGFGITKNRITISQNGQGDSQGGIWYRTKDSHINFESGKNLHVTSKEDITIHANGQKIVVKGSTIYLTGNVKLQGDLAVSGTVNARNFTGPEAHITNIYATSGGTGSGTAPNLNNPSPANLSLTSGQTGTVT